jgi:hypothetical protein
MELAITSYFVCATERASRSGVGAKMKIAEQSQFRAADQAVEILAMPERSQA